MKAITVNVEDYESRMIEDAKALYDKNKLDDGALMIIGQIFLQNID